MATEWTDNNANTWILQDGQKNFLDWAMQDRTNDFTTAAAKFEQDDKTDMFALFSSWISSTGATKKQ